ncbi:MAG: NADH:flavin oxidoreductase [Candidatus Omnitrophica bacterium]|nr:NADH:flavin oxidoreductase [Candidatus Omnitrophota bacterium]
MNIFEPAEIGNLIVKNRIIRSATYEGRCDEQGFPTDKYKELYLELAKNSIGLIITGFAYISKDGRAMQPYQAGIDSEEKIHFYKQITDEIHQYDCKIVMQIAHVGRQTLKQVTGQQVRGVSKKKSLYFNEIPDILKTEEVVAIIERFAAAALLAKRAGFDGIQLHAAHGYLIHQFISSSINNRKDIFKIDPKTRIGVNFLDMIIEQVRQRCGTDFPILVKISANDDHGFTQTQFVNLIRFLDRKKVDGIEISYGTMDYGLNIFRGNSIPIDVLLRHNPRYRTDNKMGKYLWKRFLLPIMKLKIKPFTAMYNLPYAKIAKENTDIPIICVGGFRKGEEMFDVINNGAVDFVSLCRPFICEPDLVKKLELNNNYVSMCISCNICAIMCDTKNPTKCYLKQGVAT